MKKATFVVLAGLLLLPGLGFSQKLFKKLHKYVEDVNAEFDQIEKERKEILTELRDYILEEIEADGSANLLFFCTHNSRRSQMGMAWSKAAAAC